MDDTTTPVKVELCSACTAGNNPDEPMPATGDVTMPGCGHMLSICDSCTGLLNQLIEWEALRIVTTGLIVGKDEKQKVVPRNMLCSVCHEGSTMVDLEVVPR